MPDFTIASAVCLMRSSLTLQANLFQLFHPIGGVGASAESWPSTWDVEVSRTTPRNIRMMVLTWYGSRGRGKTRCGIDFGWTSASSAAVAHYLYPALAAEVADHCQGTTFPRRLKPSRWDASL